MFPIRFYSTIIDLQACFTLSQGHVDFDRCLIVAILANRYVSTFALTVTNRFAVDTQVVEYTSDYLFIFLLFFCVNKYSHL